MMGARNFGLHLKDHDNKRKTDVVFGKGVLDVAGGAQGAARGEVQGHDLSIEYEANPKEPTKDVAACVEVFKESVKKMA